MVKADTLRYTQYNILVSNQRVHLQNGMFSYYKSLLECVSGKFQAGASVLAGISTALQLYSIAKLSTKACCTAASEVAGAIDASSSVLTLRVSSGEALIHSIAELAVDAWRTSALQLIQG